MTIKLGSAEHHVVSREMIFDLILAEDEQVYIGARFEVRWHRLSQNVGEVLVLILVVGLAS
jgi:hypothetical protein